MKKLILPALFLAASLNADLLAQRTNCPYPQHELGGGFGGLNSNQMGLLFVEPLALGKLDGLQDGNGGQTTLTPVGPAYFTYKYFFKYKGSIGATVAYNYNTLTRTPDGSNVGQKIDFHSITFAPRLDFYYIREPKFAMYGYVAAGVEGQFLSGNGFSKTGVAPAYQISLLSFRVGRKIGFVFEAGFGNLGVVNGGISYRHFNRPWGM
jgi:hypothetical protein